MKTINNFITEKLKITKNTLKQNQFKYHPKTKDELAEIIKKEVEKNGWECSLNHIDVSEITDMSYLFSISDNGYKLDKFNGDISKWDVSSVTNMKYMFAGAKTFNQPIGNWDVYKVEEMNCMFFHAYLFNQPIGDWDVSKVTNMGEMFLWAESFNQPIGDWDVSNVEDMKNMFKHSKSFNQDLSKWKLKIDCKTDDMFLDCPINEEYKTKEIK